MYLYTLGRLELAGGRLSRPKPLLLLAYLTLEGAKDRRHLGELFYIDTTSPMTGLRMAFKHIRNAAKDVLSDDDSRIKALIGCDALEFLKAVEQHDDKKTLSLYKGTFLEGFYLKELNLELEEWVVGTREYLASLVRQASLRLGETAASKGEVSLAAQYAEGAYRVAAAPPPEPRQLELIYSLLVAGKSSRASQLREEMEDLGMPLPLTSQKTQPQSLPPLPPHPGVKASTAHNLPNPTTTFVGRQTELADLTRYLRDPHHRLITLLGPGGIGKTRLSLELARSQLESNDWEGVYFLALETVQDPSFIPVYLATTLGFRLEGNDPPLEQLTALLGQKILLLVLDNFEHLTSGASLLNDLLRHLPHFKFIVSSRERLNLVAEAVYEVGGLSVPAYFEGDRVEGDNVNTKDLESSLELFLQRVQQTNLRFQLTPENLLAAANICRLVEGIPLALELAAAWVRTMPLHEIANELSTNPDFLVSQQQDALERHKSLRAVFEHSWKLLKSPEQEALQKLSVFRGGFRREAAAAVTGATIPVLASLVDKSLLRMSPSGRYDRHMLLYQFAREKLVQDQGLEQDYETRHAHYFLSLAEEAESQLRLANQSYWLERLDEETSNFQAVFMGSLRRGAIDTSLRLVSALGLFWYLRSSFEEGRYWFEKILAQPGLPPTTLHTKVLFNAGRLARSYGDFEGARGLLERGLALCQSIQNESGTVKCLNELGILAAVESHYQTATAFFERGLELAKRIADNEGLGLILSNLGFLNAILGSFDKARDLFEQGLVISKGRGDKHGTAHILNNLALVAVRQHEYARGLKLYEESLGLTQHLQDNQSMAESILGIGVACNLSNNHAKAKVHVRQSLELYSKLRKTPGIIDALCETASLATRHGDPLLAAHLWGMTGTLRKRLNFPMPPFELSRYQDDLVYSRALLEGELFDRAQAEGEFWSLDDAVQRALAWLDKA
jgi:predicted ATPase